MSMTRPARLLGMPRPVSRGITRMPAQARTDVQDVVGETRFACSLCRITYLVEMGHAAKCPLCEDRIKIVGLTSQLDRLLGEVGMIKEEAQRLQAQVDVHAAMRSALEVIGDDDLAFVKSALYQWREDRSRLVITPRGAHRRMYGFALLQRGKSATKHPPLDVHDCTSVGGCALADALRDAQGQFGFNKGMEALLKAMGPHLAGT